MLQKSVCVRVYHTCCMSMNKVSPFQSLGMRKGSITFSTLIAKNEIIRRLRTLLGCQTASYLVFIKNQIVVFWPVF